MAVVNVVEDNELIELPSSQTKIEFITLPYQKQPSSDVVEIDPVIDMSIATANKELECNSTNSEISNRQRDSTGGGKYRCSECSQSFSRRCLVLYHKRMRHCKLYPYVCDFCKVGTCSLATLVAHQQMHENRYICNKCGQSYPTVLEMKGHHCIEKRPFVCEGCGAGFSRFQNLISHSKLCNDYSCFSPNLREYRYINKSGYNCRTCKVSFAHLGTMIRHRVKHHSDMTLSLKKFSTSEGTQIKKDQIIECDNDTGCDNGTGSNNTNAKRKVLPTKSIFNKNKAMDPSKRPLYMCNLCGKVCKRQANLKQHKNAKHNNNEQQDCTSTQLNSSTSEPLPTIDQPPSSVGTSPFTCDICGKVCSKEANLRLHKTIKHYDLASESVQNSSQPTPDGVDIHICNICGKVCSKPLYLMLHKKIKHPEFTVEKEKTNNDDASCQYSFYTCKVCGKIYAKESTLKAHMNNMHTNSTTNGLHTERAANKSKDLTSPKLKNTHSTSSKSVVCKYCNKTLSHKKSLKQHVLLKHTHCKKIYQCSYCHELFDYRRTFLNHVRKHCLSLQKHRNRSSFQTWSKKLSSSSSSILHNWQKSFGSPPTAQSSPSSSSSNEDGIQPVTAPPIACKICSRTYSSNGNLTRHMKTVHNLQILCCDETLTCRCLKCSKSAKSLKKRTNGRHISLNQ